MYVIRVAARRITGGGTLQSRATSRARLSVHTPGRTRQVGSWGARPKPVRWRSV